MGAPQETEAGQGSREAEGQKCLSHSPGRCWASVKSLSLLPSPHRLTVRQELEDQHLRPFLLFALYIPNSGKQASTCALLELEKRKALAGVTLWKSVSLGIQTLNTLLVCNWWRNPKNSNTHTFLPLCYSVLSSCPRGTSEMNYYCTAQHYHSWHPISICRLQ